MSEITVSVPARPDFVHVLRSVVASVAGRASFSYDAMEDLRLAVDEACAHLLAVPGPAVVLSLRITSSDGAIEVVVWTDADPAEWPRPDVERTLTWQVLTALADEARFERTGDGPALRLTKRREAAGAA